MNHNLYRVSPTFWRYLGLHYAKTVIFVSLGFGSFTYLLDVTEHIRRLSDVETTTLTTAFFLSTLKLPSLLLELTPFIILLATLISFFALTKNRELIALRSIGLPARRFVLPALLVLFCISIFNVIAVNPLAAALQKMYEKQEAALFPDITQGIITDQGELWLKQPDLAHTQDHTETFIYAREVSRDGTELGNVTLFQFNQDGTFLHRMDASRLRFQFARQRIFMQQPQTENYWQLEEVYHFSPHQPTPTPTPGADLSLNLPATHLQWTARETWQTSLTPATIANSTVSPGTIPIWELWPFIQVLQNAGLPTNQHVLHLHRQLSLPAFLLGMFLLAIPFGLKFSRQQGLGRVLVLGVTLGFVFFMFTEIVASYGLAGRLAPAVAAWVPAAVAALVGVGLLVFYREE